MNPFLRALLLSVALAAHSSAQLPAVPVAGSSPAAGGGVPSQAGAGARDDAPVLILDGQPIPAALYAQWLLETQGEHLASTFAREHWLIAREARRRGVEASAEAVEAEVDRQIAERLAGAFHGSKAEWLSELARTGRSEEGLRRQRRVEARDRLNGRALAAIDRSVPREKVEREWWLRYGRHGRKYDLRLIQFAVRVETPRSGSAQEWKDEETRQRAARLADARRVRDLALAGADFGQLAQEHSTDAETRGRRGKPAGGFDHQGWPQTFLDELDELAPGELSQPLYARGGWWLVQMQGVTVTPLAEVEQALRADLLARGPEDDEVEVVRQRVSDGVALRVLPGMHSPPGDPELSGPESAALSIDGELVSRGEYARWVMDLWGETFARTFVEDLLVRRKAAALGITVDEAEVEARAREYVQDIIDRDFLENRQRWYDKLARSGSTEAEFLREQGARLRTSLLVEKLLLRERTVTDAELRRRYETSLGPDGVRREVSMIMLSSRYEELDHGQDREVLARELDAAIEKARLRAVDVVARLRAGADFAEVARAESDDLRTRPKGGFVAGFFRGDEYPEGIARAVHALPEGAISDPLAYGPTWLVFRVRSARKASFEELREALRAEFLSLRPGLLDVRTYRNTLASQARIEFPPAAAK